MKALKINKAFGLNLQADNRLCPGERGRIWFRCWI